MDTLCVRIYNNTNNISMTNNIEQNAILYYADFLSLRDTCTPVTDNCKYYFVYGAPINAAILCGNKPIYDVENKYYIQAYNEYTSLKDQFGDEGAMSFIEQISNLKALGTVNAKQMLQCIHQYDSRSDRKAAFRKYEKWLSNQKYEIQTINDDGELEYTQCTRYVAHSTEKERVRYSNRTN